jgi:hypothetical protein
MRRRRGLHPRWRFPICAVSVQVVKVFFTGKGRPHRNNLRGSRYTLRGVPRLAAASCRGERAISACDSRETFVGVALKVSRRHGGRRLLVHDPCPPRRRGGRFRPLRDGADHTWREQPLRRRPHPQCRCTPTSLAGQFEQSDGPYEAADFVHDPGVALHEDLRTLARAIGDGLGRAARMGGQEPARHLQDANHRRGCPQFADDRLPVRHSDTSR